MQEIAVRVAVSAEDLRLRVAEDEGHAHALPARHDGDVCALRAAFRESHFDGISPLAERFDQGLGALRLSYGHLIRALGVESGHFGRAREKDLPLALAAAVDGETIAAVHGDEDGRLLAPLHGGIHLHDDEILPGKARVCDARHGMDVKAALNVVLAVGFDGIGDVCGHGNGLRGRLEDELSARDGHFVVRVAVGGDKVVLLVILAPDHGDVRGERFGTDDVDNDARAETAVPRDRRHFDRTRLFGEDETVLLHGDAALFAAFYGGELEVVFAVCGIHGQDVDDDVFVILIFRDVHGDDAVFGSRGDLHPRDGDVHRHGRRARERHDGEHDDERDDCHQSYQFVFHALPPLTALYFLSSPTKR